MSSLRLRSKFSFENIGQEVGHAQRGTTFQKLQ